MVAAGDAVDVSVGASVGLDAGPGVPVASGAGVGAAAVVGVDLAAEIGTVAGAVVGLAGLGWIVKVLEVALRAGVVWPG